MASPLGHKEAIVDRHRHPDEMSISYLMHPELSNDHFRPASPALPAIQRQDNEMQNAAAAPASSQLDPRAPVWNPTSSMGAQSNTSVPAAFHSQNGYPAVTNIGTQYHPPRFDHRQHRYHGPPNNVQPTGSSGFGSRSDTSAATSSYDQNGIPAAPMGVQYMRPLPTRFDNQERVHSDVTPTIANGSRTGFHTPTYFAATPRPSTRYHQAMANRRRIMQPPFNTGNLVMTHPPNFIYPAPSEQAARTQIPQSSHAPPVREHGHGLLGLLDPQPPPVGQQSKNPICDVCQEEFGEKDIAHKCPRCCIKYCAVCIREWFLDACKKESKMPPRCCTSISISTFSSLFTAEQIGSYKVKLEEHLTEDRLYCPVPHCSAFVPPRLYMTPEHKSKDSQTSYAVSSPVRAKKENVPCPACAIAICTRCHSYSHSDLEKCKEGGEVDSLLEEKLKKWKIKRCPKCKAGIRKVYGCSHVQCICGGHFCFGCLRPITQCDDDDCSDAAGSSEHESEFEEDDLDGLAGYYEGDEHDFGPEPTGSETDVWGCPHRWDQLTDSSPLVINHTSANERLECLHCFIHVRTASSTSEGGPSDHQGDSHPSKGSALAWGCQRCAMIACEACKEAIASGRVGDDV